MSNAQLEDLFNLINLVEDRAFVRARRLVYGNTNDDKVVEVLDKQIDDLKRIIRGQN
jgi:hypothetical protein